MPRLSAEQCGGVNVAAFLDTIAFSELGSALMKVSDDGYNVIVGSTFRDPILFEDYSRHPNRLIAITSSLKSTAAGRYQLLNRYYEPYRKLLNLPDFSPESQDRIAIQQIKERGAFNLLKQGMFASAVFQCKNIWASLPGAGYGQHENKFEILANAFKRAGGIVAVV